MTDTIDHIEADALSPEEQARLEQDEKRWKKMADGSHLSDWLDYGPSLLKLRQIAMKAAGARRPTGGRYSEAFRALVLKHFPGMMATAGSNDRDEQRGDKTVSYVLWFYDPDHPERLRILSEERSEDNMSPGARSRLNTVKAAYDLVCRAQKRREEERKRKEAETAGIAPPVQVVGPPPPSPMAKLKQTAVDQAKEIARLETRVSDLEHDTLFEQRGNKPADISRVIQEQCRKLDSAFFDAVLADLESCKSSRPRSKPVEKRRQAR